MILFGSFYLQDTTFGIDNDVCSVMFFFQLSSDENLASRNVVLSLWLMDNIFFNDFIARFTAKVFNQNLLLKYMHIMFVLTFPANCLQISWTNVTDFLCMSPMCTSQTRLLCHMFVAQFYLTNAGMISRGELLSCRHRLLENILGSRQSEFERRQRKITSLIFRWKRLFCAVLNWMLMLIRFF